MRKFAFFSFCLFLSVMVFQLYLAVKSHFNGEEYIGVENKILKKQIEQAQFQNELLQFHFNSFKQEVAQVLPEALKKTNKMEESFPLRSLASVVTKNKSEEIKASLSENLLARGQREFAAGMFKECIKSLEHYVEEYSYSKDVVKAYAMLVESYYQLGYTEKSVKTIETMVDLFPHDEQTGFALIRLGTILKKDRPDEAAQVYMTVMQTFKQYKSLTNQARSLLGQL